MVKMGLLDSLVVSVFCMSVVFLVLAMLYAIVLGFSKVLKSLNESRGNADAVESVETDTAAPSNANGPAAPGCTAGELKLIGVDEKTAAMIMAIVSYETRIPLSELTFKSIKAIES